MTIFQLVLVITLAVEIAGIIVSGLLVIDAKADFHAVVKADVGNGRELVARGSWITERFRFATLILFAASSVVGGFRVWPYDPVPTASMWAFTLYLLAVCGVVSQSIVVYWVRRTLFDGHRSRRFQPDGKK